MLTDVLWLAPVSTFISACILPPFPLAWRRSRRRALFALILLVAVLLSTGFALTLSWGDARLIGLQSQIQSVSFAICCGVAANAAALDLFIRRVSSWHCLGVAMTGFVSASVSGTLLQAFLSSLSALATLCLAAMIANKSAGRPSLGRGDLIFVAAMALWVEPSQLPFAFLIAIAITLGLRLIPGYARPAHLPFIPGLALGFCLMAAFW